MKDKMQISALKHFLITGLAFTILPAMLVNIFLGLVFDIIEHSLGFDKSLSYFSSLLTTAFFIVAISLCMVIGNKYFARRRDQRLERQAIVQSTFLFALCVLALISFDFVDTVEIEMAFAYEYPLAVFGMISLPIIEILVLPVFYYFLAMRQLHSVAP
jgi:hypothetical protein